MRGALLLLVATTALAEDKPRPLMRDFIGLNGHTVQFKPALYAPVAKVIRDYHPVNWDVGDDTSYATTFPSARNKVDWSTLYGSWLEQGLRVNACLIFDDIKPDDDKPADAHIARVELGDEFEIFRRSVPYGTVGEHGLYFVAFSGDPSRYQRMLARMFGLDGPRDRLTDFSTPVSGGYYFAPSNAALRELAGPEED